MRDAVTVIVPTYRRPEALALCLTALAAQTMDAGSFEVIVVDDGSGDPPHALITQFTPKLRVRLLTRENGGPGAARNTGVANANTPLIAFTDDDCTPDPKWLAQLLRAYEGHQDAMIGGRVANALTGNAFAEASQLLTSFLMHWYAHPSRHHRRFFTTNNMLLPRDAFVALGGFDTLSLADTAEDRDLCDRWRNSGRNLQYAPDAIVHHAHRMSLGGFVSQHLNYGRGALYFHTAGGRDPKTTRKPESPRFYLALLRFPFREHKPLTALQFSALLLLSQVVYISGYFLERIAPQKIPTRRSNSEPAR